MATQRQIPAGVQREIERAYSSEHCLVFLTFDSDALSDTIRVVSDPIDHVYGGSTYTGFPFVIELLTDSDRPPRAQLQIQNVDRMIGSALQSLTDPLTVTITVIAGSEFLQTVNPRTEIGTAATIYNVGHLTLVDVDVNALEITGTLMLWDYSQEQWPAIMATQDRLPGLFR